MSAPVLREVSVDTIPDAMRQARRWVLWRHIEKNGKWTKIPYTPRNVMASSTDPDTWCSYSDAVKAYRTGQYAGLGFVLGPDVDRNWMGIDFDRVYDDGWTHDEWRALAESLGTYAEVSPSGTGVHVIGWGNKLNGRCKRSTEHGDIEVYDNGRYFTVTGDALTSLDVREIPQDALRALGEVLSPEPAKGQSTLTDTQKRKMPSQPEIVEMIRRSSQGAKFDELFNGGFGGHPSRSEAVYALIGIVNWWTRDSAMTHAIVSQSSLIDEAKWKRLGYREVEGQLMMAGYNDLPPWAEPDLSALAERVRGVKRSDVRDLRLTLDTPKDHFIARYVAHWSGVTDAYPDYHYATALALLSAGANGVPCVHTKNLKTIKTNLWLMILGKSSFSRKSTSIRPAMEFARVCEGLRSLPGTFSPESLLEVLDMEERCYHFKDEAAQILSGMNQKSYMADMRDLLCQLYDGSEVTRVLRSKKDTKTSFSVQRPYLTLEWATTPDSFLKATTALDSTSGFLLRFLPVYPQYPKSIMGIELGTPDIDFAEISLRNEYAELVEVINGYTTISMIPSQGAMRRFNTWYVGTQKKYEERGDECQIYQTIHARYTPIVLKIAALLAIGCAGFRWTIQTDAHGRVTAAVPDWCMDEAIRVVDEYFTPMQAHLLNAVETRSEENIQQKILGTLRDNGSLAVSDLLRRTRLESRVLRTHLETLVEAGDIIIEEQAKEGAGRPKQLVHLRER